MMKFLYIVFFVTISLQLFATAFRPTASFGMQRRRYSPVVFEASPSAPIDATVTDTVIVEAEAAGKKAKKRSSADQVDNIEQKRKQTQVWRFLKHDINFTDKQSKTIHQLYPWLFDIDYESQIKPTIDYLRSNDFQNKVLRNLVKENPFIFQKSLPEIEKRVNFLKNELFLSNAQLIHILEYQPIILSLNEQKVADIIYFFKEIIEFNPKQLHSFFYYQFRVWKTSLQDLKDYYGKLRALGYSPEQIQGRLLSNKHVQKKFFFQLPRVDSYDSRYFNEYLD